MHRLLLVFLLSACSVAATMESVEAPKLCQQCRMDRTMFAHSRALVVYADGNRTGLCSINCAVADMKNNKVKPVKSLLVADYSTRKLIEANTAVWVVGGKKKGVMTAQAKWAFASAEDARRFVEENDGVVVSFDQAMNSAITEVLDQAAEEDAVKSEMLRELQ